MKNLEAFRPVDDNDGCRHAPLADEVDVSDDEPRAPSAKDEEWEAAAVVAVQAFSTSMPKGWAEFLAMTDDLTRLYDPADEPNAEAIAETKDVSSEN